MITATKPLLDLTADDLTTRDVIRIPQDLPLREAARLLLKHQISGAPVVDAAGRCVGAFSTFDLLRLVGRRPEAQSTDAGPPTCSFQLRHRGADGQDLVLCTLAPGVCSVQAWKEDPTGKELLICSQPYGVFTDWQLVQLDKLPTNAVREFMTPDPITVTLPTPIRTLARILVDAHVHHLFVVDEDRHPVGIITSTDLLAAMARARDESPLQTPHHRTTSDYPEWRTGSW